MNSSPEPKIICGKNEKKGRKRRKRVDPDVVRADKYDDLIGLPKYILDDGVWETHWPIVHVKPTVDGRGDGVFNKGDESVTVNDDGSGAKSLVYSGVFYDLMTEEGRRCYDNAQKKSGEKGRADYMAVAKWGTNEHGESVIVGVLDAYPKLLHDNFGSSAPKYAWIGSLVNEANEGEVPNCKLEEYHGPIRQYGKYVDVKKGRCVVVTATRSIPPGGQWLTSYGTQFFN